MGVIKAIPTEKVLREPSSKSMDIEPTQRPSAWVRMVMKEARRRGKA